MLMLMKSYKIKLQFGICTYQFIIKMFISKAINKV